MTPKILSMFLAMIAQIFSILRERVAERRDAARAATDSYARFHARILAANAAARAALRAHMRTDGDKAFDHEFRRRDDL